MPADAAPEVECKPDRAEQVERVLALIESGKSERAACEEVGVNRQTFRSCVLRVDAARDRGFNTVGYHYVILLDGTVAKGRPEAVAGAHVQGHNSRSIGICYIGGLAKDAKTAKDTRTDAQKVSLAKLVKSLHAHYPWARVRGHRDFSPDLNRDSKIAPNEWMKDCPCFDVASWGAATKAAA